jgi:hypothetical protein
MTPNPDCKICLGTGTVTDWVDYGSTIVPMYSDCDCIGVGPVKDYKYIVDYYEEEE